MPTVLTFDNAAHIQTAEKSNSQQAHVALQLRHVNSGTSMPACLPSSEIPNSCIDARCGCHVITLTNIDHRHTPRSKSIMSIISMVTVGTVATGTCTCTTYLSVTLSVVLFRWHSSVYLASPYRTLPSRQATRFRILPIPLPFSNRFLLLLCLILFTFRGPFLFWFARLLDTFHVQRSISSLIRPTA